MGSGHEIVNRVAASSLITFDLEDYYQTGERVVIDIKDQLYHGMILKEKDFRDFLKTHDWSQYQNKFVAITCSIDAIIPIWAYMLIGIVLEPFARQVVFGSLEELESEIYRSTLDSVDWEKYKDAKVVIKGCSKVEVPVAIYVYVTNKLKPIVSSLMFGEACSTVPLYKKAKTNS